MNALAELRQGISPAEYPILRDNPDLTLTAVHQILASLADLAAGRVEPYRVDDEKSS